MENSEIQLGDKNKQLEFLRNIWKAADSKSKVVKSEFDTTDKCNIDLNSKKTKRRDRYAYTHSAESQLIFTDSEDEDFLENRQSSSSLAKSHAADDDNDEVIHNNFFARDVTPQVGREIFTSSSLPTGLIVVVNSDRSKSEARKSSDDENPPQEEIGSDEDSTTTEASKSGWKDIKAGSMVMLSVSYRHKACRSMDVTDLSNVFYRKSQSGIKYDDEFSDGANDDYDSDHYQTHCHNQQHHCHHQHQHCHHNHQGHHIVCRTHGSSYSGKEDERKEKYPFDYCDVEREPPKSFRTIGGCGTCRNCKTGNMVSTMEQLTETIDCEIHDVVPDGNCLFRSVVDQLRMNGEFHWTARTIRHKAVEFLRENPCHEDGSHLGMFLSTESWDEYLSRMSRDKEWGDQLILRGISNVLGRNISIISAIGSGHNQTTIEPSFPTDDITKKEPIQLGHFEEQHYVSLRKKNWSDTWFEHGRRVNSLLMKDYTDFESDVESDNIDEYFGTATDMFTSVPFIHLHFLINKSIPIKAFNNEKFLWSTNETKEDISEQSSKGYRSVRVGNIEEELDSNLSFLPKFGISYNKRNDPSICITRMDIRTDCVVLNDIQETSQVESHFYLDLENMSPPFTKLVVIQPSSYAGMFIKFKDGTAYLSAKFLLRYSANADGVKLITGIECLKWPSDILNSWLTRERPACWPSKDIITKVSEEKCVVVPCESPDNLTWRLNFMLPIRVLVKEGTTSHQRHCYRVFKLLIDVIASTEKANLPSYALKSVFLYAMEKIPSTFWTDNKGGCLLYLLDRLLFSIHRRQMPDYFIPSWNLLEDVAEEECQSLYSRIMAIRQFPIISIVLVTEKRGLPGSSIAEPLIDHIESINSGHYIEGSERDVFFQISIEDVKNKLWNYFIRDATDSFVELYEEVGFDIDGSSMEEFACSYFQDLPNSMQWWFYFFLDHFHNTRALKFIMGSYGGTLVRDLLGPNRKNGKFDEVRIPDPLLQEAKYHNALQEADVAFLLDLSMKLTLTREFDHGSHYTMELIRLLKEKIKAIADFSQGKNDQALYQTNYQDQMMTMRYYMVMMISFQRLFKCLKQMGNTDLFTEYIEDAENACALIGMPDNYYSLAEFYRSLGCTEKYREAMRIYNGGSSDDTSKV